MSEFDGATLAITGGTGSIGSTVFNHLLETDPNFQPRLI